MNYRHAFHAGNFADVLKHLVVCLCLSHLRKKADKPCAYIDSHAGIGLYDLTSDEARRSPEWQAGVGRILDADMPDDVAQVLAPWRAAVRAVNPGDGLTQYPGSPMIAAGMLGPQDRLHLCELHEADARLLDSRFARDRRVKVERRDGYAALAALLPPKEKRGLVLVDPPFEHRDEMAHMAEAAIAGLSRFPTGSFIFWRPLKDLWAAERFDVGLSEWLMAEKGLLAEKILRADLWVRDPESEGKLAGAGVMVINPPYTLEADLLVALPWLCDRLQEGPGAGWRVDGGLTEDSLTVDEF